MTITFSEYAASSRLHLIPIRWISVLPPPAGRMNSVRAAKLEFARALLTKKQITKGGWVTGLLSEKERDLLLKHSRGDSLWRKSESDLK